MKPLVGVGLVGMGVVMVFGGITGRLAPMLAALFYPSGLVPGSGNMSRDGVPKGLIPDLPQLFPGIPDIHIPDVPGVGFISQPTTPAPVQVNPYVNPGVGVRQVPA